MMNQLSEHSQEYQDKAVLAAREKMPDFQIVLYDVTTIHLESWTEG